MTTTRQAAPAPHREPGEEPGAGGNELLDVLVDESLQWTERHLDSFRLPPEATTTADPNLTLKPLGELAELTGMIASCHPLPALRARAERLFAYTWQETREGDLLAELVRGEPQAGYPVELYGVFARAGLRNAAAEKLIRTTTALRGWQVAQDDHTRTLSMLNAEARIGLRPHAEFGAVLAHTGLGRLSEPWFLDCRTAYGLTHDVFHVTDWGRERTRLAPSAAEYLRLWLPAWVAGWLEEESWDLVGELLAVAACVPGAPFDPVAWRRLADARTPDGALTERGAPPVPGTGTAEVFRACYHSTLVLAFAATLARTTPAPAPTPAPTPDSEATG
ncbi:DUF6895 family protein [Streptomyces spirodelae]|uniref:DUF6895 domain-containing protein n=1 Tax=Streptomyces spirodelae TaxID=2812904 RepID=A0ABS3WS14_9ACTN|nr:hypothetical protein [Streptomyces spirodelae]MBO8185906.1 hypothetical protein [Streptomyces spirodelae]